MGKAARRKRERRAAPPPVRPKGLRSTSRAWMLIGAATLAAVAIAGAVYFAGRDSAGGSGQPASLGDRLQTSTIDPANETWPPNTYDLPGLMRELNLPIADPPQLHTHSHLDLYVEGEKVVVPMNLGLSPEAEVPLHTHDTEGIIHVESTSTALKPTLGLFFDVWGVRFSSSCLGGYCAEGGKQLWVYTNGTRYSGDPRALPLTDKQEIVVAYGTRAQLPDPIPRSYRFPGNL